LGPLTVSSPAKFWQKAMIHKKHPYGPLSVITALALLVFTLTPPCVFAEATKQEILSGMQKRYAGMNDLTADYARETSSPAMESLFRVASEHKASGRLFFKKPNKLLINQIKPRPEKLVTNGVTVWWYIPEENLVQRYSGPNLMIEVKPFVDFLAGLDSLTDRFTITLTPAKDVPEPIHELVLEPIEKGTGPQKISLWLDTHDYTLIGFRFTSILKETTDFHLSNISYNQDLKTGQFDFQIPPGAEVMDADAQ